jgi:hypothetical protein
LFREEHQGDHGNQLHMNPESQAEKSHVRSLTVARYAATRGTLESTQPRENSSNSGRGVSLANPGQTGRKRVKNGHAAANGFVDSVE